MTLNARFYFHAHFAQLQAFCCTNLENPPKLAVDRKDCDGMFNWVKIDYLDGILL